MCGVTKNNIGDIWMNLKGFSFFKVFKVSVS